MPLALAKRATLAGQEAHPLR